MHINNVRSLSFKAVMLVNGAPNELQAITSFIHSQNPRDPSQGSNSPFSSFHIGYGENNMLFATGNDADKLRRTLASVPITPRRKLNIKIPEAVRAEEILTAMKNGLFDAVKLIIKTKP